MIWGLLAGAFFAAGDGWLLCWILRKAASQPARAKNWLIRGMLIALLLQKVFLTIAVLLCHKKENN